LKFAGLSAKNEGKALGKPIESINGKLGGRFTIRKFFESVTDALRIGYLIVTVWM